MSTNDPAYISELKEGCIVLRLTGDWSIGQALPELNIQMLTEKLLAISGANTNPHSLCLIDESISRWDSMLMLFVMQCYRWSQAQMLTLDVQQMPPAVSKLLAIATAVAPYELQTDMATKKTTFSDIFTHSTIIIQGKALLAFSGLLSKAFVAFLRGRSNARAVDILYFINQVGPKGLGIITLTSVLVGMILAYLGSVQLRQLGAEIYVASLVGIGMTREMGALMTGIILAGRTGAAYAAQLGTMQVNEEIDAIQTMAMSSMEFLVLPRMLALILIMPLLCIYSDVLGMVGGAVIAMGMDIGWNQYLLETQRAVDLTDFFCGVIKSIFFAVLIGVAGCQAGLQCGRDSTAVGHATTTAVVRAIVYLIVADAAINILYDKLGI